MHRGLRVLVADLVPERLLRVAGRGAEPLDLTTLDASLGDVVRDRTDGRGADAVIDAVGMEAHGSGVTKAMHKMIGFLPDALAEPLMLKAGVDRLAALTSGIDAVRRGGTVSISGVYGGAMDPLPLFQMFDKQLQLRMGQANVRSWTDDILQLLDQDKDVLGVESFATHHVPLEEAPWAYENFQKKQSGVVKVVFQP
jgi:threonine dehydrogenase-like Zn-dependent dehydrogenase